LLTGVYRAADCEVKVVAWLLVLTRKLALSMISQRWLLFAFQVMRIREGSRAKKV